METRARGEARAYLDEAASFRAEIARLSGDDLEQVLAAQPIPHDRSLRQLVAVTESRRRALRSRRRTMRTIRTASIPALVRRALKSAPEAALEEINRRAHTPLDAVSAKNVPPTSWDRRAFGDAWRHRRQSAAKRTQRDLIDDGWLPYSDQLKPQLRSALREAREALAKGWACRTYWTREDGCPVLHWQEGRRGQAVKLPSALDLPRERKSFLASERPARREDYDGLLRRDPIARVIFDTWLTNGLPAIGMHGFLYLRALSLADDSTLAFEALLLLDDILSGFLRPLAFAGEAYYAERIPADTARKRAVATAFVGTMMVCGLGMLGAFPPYPNLPALFTRPLAFVFKIALARTFGVAFPSYERIVDDEEFTRAVEGEWERLKTVQITVPVAGGSINRRGVLGFAFDFDVVPLITPAAFSRYVKLPLPLRQPSVVYEVDNYLAHSVCGSLGMIFGPLFENALYDTLVPLRKGAVRRAARQLSRAHGDEEVQHRPAAESAVEHVFRQLVPEFDVLFPRPRDAVWRGVGTVAVEQAPDRRLRAETYPMVAYLKRKLQHRVDKLLDIPGSSRRQDLALDVFQADLESVGEKIRASLAGSHKRDDDEENDDGAFEPSATSVQRRALGAPLTINRDRLQTIPGPDRTQLCTASSLATVTGFSRSTLRGWLSHLGPEYRSGRVSVLYRANDIDALEHELRQIADRQERRRRHEPSDGLTVKKAAALLTDVLGVRVTPRHLRRLERKGGVVPRRDRHGYRVYGEDELQRSMVILKQSAESCPPPSRSRHSD